jgi:hypothetical protein
MFVIFSQWIHRLKCLDYIFAIVLGGPLYRSNFSYTSLRAASEANNSNIRNLRPAKIDVALFQYNSNLARPYPDAFAAL